jgi:hypothetical protein
MNRIQIQPNRPHLYGATLAQKDMGPVADIFGSVGQEACIVEFDFRNVESISGSYIRATVLWCLLSGKMFAEAQATTLSASPWGIRPLPIYPLVVGKEAEVLGEIDDLLKQRGLAALAVTEPSSPPFSQAILLGELDAFLMAALRLLSEHGPCVAQKLKEESKESISIGGWSNRLAALYSHRLVTRVRDGKSWIYQTLAKEHTSWV